MQTLLNLNELAEILRRSADTIKKDLRRCPLAVPPRVIIPGTRVLRWREADVEKWIAALPTSQSMDSLDERDD